MIAQLPRQAVECSSYKLCFETERPVFKPELAMENFFLFFLFHHQKFEDIACGLFQLGAV